MKKMVLFLLVCVAVSTFAVASIAGGKADNQAGDQATDLQSSKNWNKVGDTLQQAWLQYLKDGNGDLRVECFVVSSESIGESDQDMLLGAGFATQVATGWSARGHMKIKDLPRVLNVFFVRKIKLATK